MPTYCVETWDHDADDFTPEARGVSLWGLRAVIRDLLGRGYDTVSILISREPEESPRWT